MTNYDYEIINSKYGKIAVPTGHGWRHPNGLVDNVRKKVSMSQKRLTLLKIILIIDL